MAEIDPIGGYYRFVSGQERGVQRTGRGVDSGVPSKLVVPVPAYIKDRLIIRPVVCSAKSIWDWTREYDLAYLFMSEVAESVVDNVVKFVF
jgi:hypothetical protein